MSDKVYIGNLALSHLGDKGRISSLTENTKQARAVNSHYDHVLRVVLRALNWRFATAVRVLSLTTDVATPDGWLYTYAYPSDCIRFRHVDNGVESFTFPHIHYPANHQYATQAEQKVPFELRSTSSTARVIVTNQEDAVGVYTRYMDDPTIYAEDFVQAMSHLLAATICKPVTGDVKLSQEQMQLFQGLLGFAGSTDANEGHKEHRIQASSINARA